MMANVIKAPHSYDPSRKSVFLGGSIEMGKAEDWQRRITEELMDLDIDILNPRRDDWNPNWEQSIFNPDFKEQVVWEQNALETANLIVMYFAAGTQSPITLMEFGQFIEYGPVVYCPEGFWRKGNVDIVAERNGIEVYDNYEEFVAYVKKYFRRGC